MKLLSLLSLLCCLFEPAEESRISNLNLESRHPGVHTADEDHSITSINRNEPLEQPNSTRQLHLPTIDTLDTLDTSRQLRLVKQVDPIMSDRQTLLRDAVAFLRDPKVATSPLTQRVQFLETKGLTSDEIESALAQVKAVSVSSSAVQERPAEASTYAQNYDPAPRFEGRSYAGGGAGVMMREPPPLPGRDWRDFFIMAVISGGVMYGMVAMARKYLLPHLQPPTQTAFEATSTSLTAQFDEATKLLSELQAQTTTLQTSVEEERGKVDAVVGEVEEAVRAVKDGEERWREEMRELRDEVGEVRELVPRMLEKHAQTQAASLLDLQSELKSLKTLLLARRPGTGTSPSRIQNGSHSDSSTTGSSTERAANALLQPRSGSSMGFGSGGKPSIPAWQLAATSPADGGANGTSEANGEKEAENAGVQVETVPDAQQ